MIDMEERIAQWHYIEHGPDVDAGKTFRKLCEEVGELGEALMLHSKNPAHVAEEAADVAIVLSHIVRAAGSTLFLQMERKLTVLECNSALRRGVIE